jgi:hypothetical protein
MKRLPILIAVAVLAAGIAATAYYGLRDSGGTSAQAPTDLDRVNAKLKAHGQPTLPPEPTQTARAALAAAQPTATLPVDIPSPWCGPAGHEFTSTKYGEVRNCVLIGSHWLVVTLGDRQAGVRGVVGVLDCRDGDASCLQAAATPPANRQDVPSGWAVYESPFDGGLTLLGRPSPDVVELASSGGQICFSVETRSFDVRRPCGR